ncbi:RAMP superfamily protein [Limnothrix redekei]
MPAIPDSYKKVPMMFRAQIDGRSQLQRLDSEKRSGKPKEGQLQDVEVWVDEWVDKAEQIPAQDAQDKQTPVYSAKSYQISWRFVTNGGQDDGIIRPVLGKAGIPFYPGSSMKGAFRNACEQAEASGVVAAGSTDRYCGKETDLHPGILRFLGAYPTNDWTEGLVDLVHPQQGWQVKAVPTNQKPTGESAYALVSLYQPTLRFAISSNRPLSDAEWQTIWTIWERALSVGLGSKTATGYGQLAQVLSVKPRKVLYSVSLKGQGQAAKLIDGSGEFRHNIFRASLRGHALRLFGGLTDAKTADQLVEDLFGGIQSGEPTVGFLGLQFRESKLEIESFGSGSYAQPAYLVEGKLNWLLNRPLANANQENALMKLVTNLMRFAMLVGGFGKSWRRADHREFFEDYYEDSYKALIGCHWQWLDEQSQLRNTTFASVERITPFLDNVRAVTCQWMELQGITVRSNQWAKDWREAWHPSNVQVWSRLASSAEDSVAVYWFHKPYQPAIQGVQSEGSIYKKPFTGKIGTISRIIHRMYPVIRLVPDPNSPGKKIPKKTIKYLEVLTIFPDDSQECRDFLAFLSTNPDEFQQVWGDVKA